MSLKQLLSERRDDILERFVRDVERKGLAPPGMSRSVLVDQLPLFLTEIIAELASPDHDESASRLSASARQHGEQRWQHGYHLQALIREYGVLRHAILETAKSANLALSGDEFDVLSSYMNLGVSEATAEYVRSREDELTARKADLEFLSEAGELLGSSLDYHATLARLTSLLVPRLADFCIVHIAGSTLEELPIAHVNSARTESIRALLQRLPWPDPADRYGAIVRDGKPVLAPAVPPEFLGELAQSTEHLQALRELGVRSWLAVPLAIKTHVIGTIALAWSDSARHYEPSDLLLANDLARRAATAIDNAQLYELAQSERARAEAATRAKDEFVGVVTHELRTPLNAIIGWVRLLRSGALNELARDHALGVIERNADAQGRLVADLLDISHVLTGKVRLDPAQVDLGNLLRLVLEDARLALESKRLQLQAIIAHDDTVMRGDAERLKQIIWNLLLNAIKFTPKDGQIRVSLRRVDSELELRFTDTGVGMAADFLPYAFDRFRQFDSKITRRHGGLGIGLSIVKHLVDLHGGTAEAHSDGVGKGATFLVRLPLSPVISTILGVTKVAIATAPRQQTSAPQQPLSGLRVLVVDDEDDARDLLRAVLSSRDAEVYDAGSAREALALLESTSVDAIISDIGMPEQDGYWFIREVRALLAAAPNPEKAGVPAIALTAFAREEDRKRALLEGFNVHLAKPVEPAELLTVLTELVGRRGPGT
jgi:signal transduction histidine kinase/ActR/RegA family two-component response regulator